MEDLKQLYNRQYVDKLAHQTHFKIERLLINIDFRQTDIVADYGCGDGKLSLLINNKIAEYHGVDFSEAFIEEARKINTSATDIQFYCEDIIEFSKKNQNRFDKAFSLDFTEHIYDEDFFEIFSAIRDTLKPNGELYIHTPNGSYILEIMKRHNFILKQFPEHIAVRTANENKTILENIGFSKIVIRFIAHYVKLLAFFHFLSFIPIIGKYFKARLFIKATK